MVLGLLLSERGRSPLTLRFAFQRGVRASVEVGVTAKNGGEAMGKCIVWSRSGCEKSGGFVRFARVWSVFYAEISHRFGQASAEVPK